MYAKYVDFFPYKKRDDSLLVLFWISGILSCFLDNVSYGMTLSTMLKRLHYSFDLHGQNLAYTMMLSQQLSCNCCIISSVSNLIATDICARRGPEHSISFIKFIREGSLITLISLLIATLFIYLMLI